MLKGIKLFFYQNLNLNCFYVTFDLSIRTRPLLAYLRENTTLEAQFIARAKSANGKRVDQENYKRL